MNLLQKVCVVTLIVGTLIGFKLWFTIFQDNQEIQIKNQYEIIELLRDIKKEPVPFENQMEQSMENLLLFLESIE